jgi:hypothetical protein
LEAPIKYIQALPGHNDIKTTLRYTPVSQKSLKNIKSPLDGMVKKNAPFVLFRALEAKNQSAHFALLSMAKHRPARAAVLHTARQPGGYFYCIID